MSQSNQETKPAPFDVKALASIERASSGLSLSPLTRAALENGIPFDDVYAYAQAAARAASKPLEIEYDLQAELDVALFENFHAREPRRSVLFWKEAGL